MKPRIQSLCAVALSGLLLAACSKELGNEPQLHNTAPTAQSVVDNVPRVKFSLQARTSVESLRALGNLKNIEDRLRPTVTADNKVKILLVVGSTTTPSEAVDIVETNWTYVPDGNHLFFDGDVAIKESLVSDAARSGLQMMLVVAPEGSYDATSKKLTMTPRLATQEQMTTGTGFSIPYFSDWIPLADYMEGNSISLKGRDFHLKPQGMVLQVRAREFDPGNVGNIKLRRVSFESNIMSRSGDYALGSVQAGAQVSYTPASTEQPVGDTPQGTSTGGYDAVSFAQHPNKNQIYYHEFTTPTEPILGGTQVYYLWTEARPNVQQPYTRTYMEVRVGDPLLSDAFVGNDAPWTGSNGKRRLVVHYSNNDFTSNGATLDISYNPHNALTPLNNYPATYFANAINTDGVTPSVDLEPIALHNYAQRNYSSHTLYTWKNLRNHRTGNKNPSSPQYDMTIQVMGPNIEYDQRTVRFQTNPYQFTNLAPNTKDNNTLWLMPTVEQLACLLPVSTGDVARDFFKATTSSRGEHKGTVDELVSLGSYMFTPTRYRAHYVTGGTETDGSHSIYALRFLGIADGASAADVPYTGSVTSQTIPSDQNKTLYCYRYYNAEPAKTRLVVEARYLGSYFPEVSDTDKLLEWSGFLNSMITRDERTLAQPMLEAVGTASTFKGVRLWLQGNSTATGHHYTFDPVAGKSYVTDISDPKNSQAVASVLLTYPRN